MGRHHKQPTGTVGNLTFVGLTVMMFFCILGMCLGLS